MNLQLNGAWEVYGFERKGGKNPPFGVLPALEEASLSIPGEVPGNVQTDLMRAGLEGDPFFGDTYYDYIKYENWCWAYRRTFALPQVESDETYLLRFGGIDTIADVFVNGALVGHSEDMFVEQTFNATGALKSGENEVIVHIFSAVNHVRQIAYPVTVFGSDARSQIPYLRKAAHCFGWDIFPRLVTVGLWREVTLFTEKKTAITETYFAVSAADADAAVLRWAVRFQTDADRIEACEIRVSGVCGESSFEFRAPAVFNVLNGCYTVIKPRLWQPRGYGEPNLYTVKTQLLMNGEVADEKTERIGLRHIKLSRSFEPGEQTFRFYVNGVPVFCKGTNWVPTDALHARAACRTERAVALAAGCGCNMIRCWGGGIYEDELFYTLCDEAGILVWQDFAMGNACYPQDGSTDALLEDEAAKLIRRIRNHPSVCVYAGDNEIDSKYANYDYPEPGAVYNRISREVLPRLVHTHDPYRQYLNSSPEIPFGMRPDTVPEQHTWGARAWYKDDFYKNSSAAFIGEAGYHGCPAPESLRRFIPAERLWESGAYPFENRYYAAHSTHDLRTGAGHDRNRMLADQVRILCGELPADLETFSAVSQLSQAEALKFFIERSRALSDKRGGVLWWNLLDGWPQISDAVTDYYFTVKTAWHHIRCAQRPVLAFLGEQQGWDLPVLISNDTALPHAVSFRVFNAETGETLQEGEATLEPCETRTVGAFRWIPGKKALLMTAFTADGATRYQHFIAGMPPYPTATLLSWIKLIRQYQEKEEWEQTQ